MLRAVLTITLLVLLGCTVRLQFEYENPSTEEADVMGTVLDSPFDKGSSGKVVNKSSLKRARARQVERERLRNRFSPAEVPMGLVSDPNLRQAVKFAAGARVVQVTACGLCIAYHPERGILGIGVQRPMPRGASPYPCADSVEEQAQCPLFEGPTQDPAGSEEPSAGMVEVASVRPKTRGGTVRHQVHPEGLDGTVGDLDPDGR